MVIGKLLLKNKILLLLLSFSFLFSLQIRNEVYKEIKNGDIIFRRENNNLSKLFAKINSSYYSHSGIIFIKNHVPYVIHIEGGFNKDNDICIQTLQDYLENAVAIKIMRYKKKIDKKKFFKLINFFSKRKIKFDFEFKLNNDKLYCTEFVNYFYFKMLHKNIITSVSKVYNKKVILIKNFLFSPFLKVVYKTK